MPRISGLIAATLFTLTAANEVAMAQAAAGPSGLHVVGHLAGPDGGWDYASFDEARRRLYVAHGARVLAIEADTGALNADFATGDHLHAVVPIPDSDLILTTNSGDSTARILGAKDGRLIASVPTASDPDAAIYDAADRLVIVMGGDSGVVTLVDPRAGKAVGSIKVGGALEYAALDARGRLYINREDKGDIAVIDLIARKVVTTYPMPGCVAPTGLLLAPGDRLISSCANGVAQITNSRTGRMLASLKIGVGPDAVLYDRARNLAYIPSGRAGSLAVIALTGPRANTVIDIVPTQVGARTGAVDIKTGRIYLPTAEYGPPLAPGQRPVMKPGTFQVLVLGRN